MNLARTGRKHEIGVYTLWEVQTSSGLRQSKTVAEHTVHIIGFMVRAIYEHSGSGKDDNVLRTSANPFIRGKN